jgi:transketolase
VRREFVAGLVELAEADDRVALLTGDLGFMALEPFAERFPDRFFNVGVAEQNMVGIATGLAEAGFIPFVWSIATFATLRPYEFIRNGPVAQGLPVRIVGIGGGFDYAHNGLSHFALEDIAVLRAQPALRLLVPADGDQARAAVRALPDIAGPAYIRVGRNSTPVPGLDGRFACGRLAQIGERTDVVIVATGSITHSAVAAAERLERDGIEASVAVVSSFNPGPDDDLCALLANAGLALSVEAGYVQGGLGSYVAELIAEHRIGCGLRRCGVRTVPSGAVGTQQYLEARHGLSPEALADTVRAALELPRVGPA